MHDITKNAIERIVKKTAHVLTVKDFDAIEELDELARAIVNTDPEERRLLNQPFELCGVAFYPLTIAKSMWYAEKCEEWQLDGIYQRAFLFWLLTLPLKDDALDEFATKKQADKAAKKLSRKLHCTAEQMTDVFERCVGGEHSKDGEEPAKYGSLVALLLREYGGTPDQWLYETPVEKIGALVDQYVHKINSENAANESAAGKSGKAFAPSQTGKLVALQAFKRKTVEIRKSWEIDER